VQGLEAEARNWHVLLLMHISTVSSSWHLEAMLLGTCAARVSLMCVCERERESKHMHVQMCMFICKLEVKLLCCRVCPFLV